MSDHLAARADSWGAQVFWNESRRRYMVALTLDADEAENVGHALGIRDAGGRDLIDCAHKAQDLNRERAES